MILKRTRKRTNVLFFPFFFSFFFLTHALGMTAQGHEENQEISEKQIKQGDKLSLSLARARKRRKSSNLPSSIPSKWKSRLKKKLLSFPQQKRNLFSFPQQKRKLFSFPQQETLDFFSYPLLPPRPQLQIYASRSVVSTISLVTTYGSRLDAGRRSS